MGRIRWIAIMVVAISGLVFGFSRIQSDAEPSPGTTSPAIASLSAISPSWIEPPAPVVQPPQSQQPVSDPKPESIPEPAPKADAEPPVLAELEAVDVSIPVLNYHSIGIEPDNSLVLDPKQLAKQMEYLAKEGYAPLTMEDFKLILDKRKAAPPKPVLLTFDDGYSDNYELAMPVLQRYHFPATVFLSPGMIGNDGYLTWDQVKTLHEASWDIQPHGMTHPHLPKMPAAKMKEEITEARRLIVEQLGAKADVFCYPYGEFNKLTLAILQEEGFRYAFTIEQGPATSAQPPLQLRRIYVSSKDSFAAWVRKLTAASS